MRTLSFIVVLSVLSPLMCTAYTGIPPHDLTTLHVTAVDVFLGQQPSQHDDEGHGLPAKAVEIGRVFNFPITNSIVVSWIVALGLIIFAQLSTRKMELRSIGAPYLMTPCAMTAIDPLR